jgi:MbtH protein
MAVDETTPDDWIVVVNEEEQYSLWPRVNSIPQGWRAVTSGLPKAAAVAYVETHWVDMRPKSLRGAAVGDGSRGG